MDRNLSSSTKMTDGDSFLAKEKRAFVSFSASPNHLEVIVDPVTFIKLAPASVATAFARRLLPVPGGPNSNTPLHGSVWITHNGSVPV